MKLLLGDLHLISCTSGPWAGLSFGAGLPDYWPHSMETTTHVRYMLHRRFQGRFEACALDLGIGEALPHCIGELMQFLS